MTSIGQDQEFATRRRIFSDIRKAAKLSYDETARATGLSPKSVRVYGCPSSVNSAPAWERIEALRQAAVRKAALGVEDAARGVQEAEAKLSEAKSYLQDLQELSFLPAGAADAIPSVTTEQAA